MELEELKEKISREGNISVDDVNNKIEEKIIELSGLVSEEGAAYIVAKELGLDLLEKRDLSLKIKNILPGLKAVEVIGKVMSISTVKEFDRNERKGRVQNIVIGDETGTIRVVFWNDLVRYLESLREGDVIKVIRGFTKPNSFGMPEIHMGNTSSIEKVDKEITVGEFSKPFAEGGGFGGGQMRAQRRDLSQTKENEFIEVRAIIVSTSENEYITCPKCDGRIDDTTGEYTCGKDGKVEPKRNLIVKGYLDDGIAAKRFVSFRDVAQKIKKDKLIGKEKVFVGKVKKNDFFGDMEVVLNQIKDVDYEVEVEKLL